MVFIGIDLKKMALSAGLSLLLISGSAKAGSLEEFSYTLINGSCPSRTPLTPKLESGVGQCEICQPNQRISTKNVDHLKSLSSDVSKEVYLSKLAKARSENLLCTTTQIQHLLDHKADQNSFVDTYVEKIEQIAFDKQKMRLLEPAIQTNPEAKAEYTAAKIRIKARIASMPFADIPYMSKTINGIITNIDPTVVKKGKVDPKMESFFKEEIRSALKSSLRQVEVDRKELNQGVSSMGTSLSRATRESLAQDIELVEQVRQMNGDSQNFKAVACEVDAEYGKGAQYRDAGIAALAIIATAGEYAVEALAARSALAASATGAAAIGAISTRTAGILRAVSMLPASVAIYNHVQKQCFSGANLKSKTLVANKCETNVVHSTTDCPLTAVLSIAASASVLASWSKSFSDIRVAGTASKALATENSNAQAVKIAIEKIDEGAPPDVIRNAVGKIDDALDGGQARLIIAQKLLHRETLSPAEQDWILAAHRARGDVPYGEQGPTILRDQITLRNTDLPGRPTSVTPKDTRVLVENGVLGNGSSVSSEVGSQVSILRSNGFSNGKIVKDKDEYVDVQFRDVNGQDTLRTVAKTELQPALNAKSGHVMLGDDITLVNAQGVKVTGRIEKISEDRFTVAFTNAQGRKETAELSTAQLRGAKKSTDVAGPAEPSKATPPPQTQASSSEKLTPRDTGFVLSGNKQGTFSGKTESGEYYGQTDFGQGIKYNSNEDSILFHVDKNGNVHGAVFDGLGGHAGGEVASDIAAKYMKQRLSGPNPAAMEKIVEDTPKHMSEVYKKTGAGADDMGTTMTGFSITNGELKVVNAGDSRTVVLRQDAQGKYQFIGGSKDHEDAQGVITNLCLLDKGAPCAIAAQLNPPLKLQPGDRIISGTDGLWEMMDHMKNGKKLNNVMREIASANISAADKAAKMKQAFSETNFAEFIGQMNKANMTPQQMGEQLRKSVDKLVTEINKTGHIKDDNYGAIIFQYRPQP